MHLLDKEAREEGTLVVLDEVGLDPGIDNLYMVKIPHDILCTRPRDELTPNYSFLYPFHAIVARPIVVNTSVPSSNIARPNAASTGPSTPSLARAPSNPIPPHEPDLPRGAYSATGKSPPVISSSPHTSERWIQKKLVDMCPPASCRSWWKWDFLGPTGSEESVVITLYVDALSVRNLKPSPTWTVTYEEARSADMCGRQVLEIQVMTWVWC
jgi:hypothetical protein